MVRSCTRNHPWGTFGNDMLLGLRADQTTDMRQQEFLPENLMYDIDRASIYANGEYRPLVKERRIALQSGVQIIEQDFPLTPIECACLLLILSIIIAMMEWKRRKTFKYWDAILMTVQGLAGCVLFVMIFSQHPTTSLNLQLLLLNPLPLFFIPAVLRRRKTRWWIILAVMIILFAIGSLFQHYAEGLMILALSLLIRVIINFKLQSSKFKVEK
jgi:membrane-associated HD superfamily phosphohydrolase